MAGKYETVFLLPSSHRFVSAGLYFLFYTPKASATPLLSRLGIDIYTGMGDRTE